MPLRPHDTGGVMAEQDTSREQPDIPDGQPHYRADEHTGAMPPGVHHTDAKGFIGSLFDVSFSSFVTPKVIRVLYLLIIVFTVLSALVYTILAFRDNAGLGFVTLFVLAPLFTLIVLAAWRIFLEFFMVIFRIADDVRDMRRRSP
jgi:hypothetical protein